MGKGCQGSLLDAEGSILINFKSSHRLTIDQEVHDLLKADHGEIGQSDGIGGFASSRRLLHGFLAVAIERFISFRILVERICRGN